MMRLFGFALGILLLAPAHRVMGQAQVTVPPPGNPKPSPASVDAASDTDELADAGGSGDSWLQQQAGDLLDVVGCYLPKKSLENEVAKETKISKDPKHLIEVRIRLLKTLASHNTASHCK
jgi:hypothetical protein